MSIVNLTRQSENSDDDAPPAVGIPATRTVRCMQEFITQNMRWVSFVPSSAMPESKKKPACSKKGTTEMLSLETPMNSLNAAVL